VGLQGLTTHAKIFHYLLIALTGEETAIWNETAMVTGTYYHCGFDQSNETRIACLGLESVSGFQLKMATAQLHVSQRQRLLTLLVEMAQASNSSPHFLRAP